MSISVVTGCCCSSLAYCDDEPLLLFFFIRLICLLILILLLLTTIRSPSFPLLFPALSLVTRLLLVCLPHTPPIDNYYVERV